MPYAQLTDTEKRNVGLYVPAVEARIEYALSEFYSDPSFEQKVDVAFELMSFGYGEDVVSLAIAKMGLEFIENDREMDVDEILCTCLEFYALLAEEPDAHW